MQGVYSTNVNTFQEMMASLSPLNNHFTRVSKSRALLQPRRDIPFGWNPIRRAVVEGG